MADHVRITGDLRIIHAGCFRLHRGVLLLDVIYDGSVFRRGGDQGVGSGSLMNKLMPHKLSLPLKSFATLRTRMSFGLVVGALMVL